MSPKENLNDFISGQVGWLEEFKSYYIERMCKDETVADEMQPSEWFDLYVKWRHYTLESWS